jgi:hypothetical protein
MALDALLIQVGSGGASIARYASSGDFPLFTLWEDAAGNKIF